MPVKHEEKDFVMGWTPNQWYRGYSDAHVRQDLWMKWQSQILPEIQKWLDKGWSPVTEIGPSAFNLRHYKVWDGTRAVLFTLFTAGLGIVAAPFMKEDRVEPTEFRVKMRRLKKS